MIVPKYWAEERYQHRQSGKQITIRRFGWSDTSIEEAQAHARQRVDEAFQSWLSGDKDVSRRELKAAYNGAEGVPIREEIISEHGDTIITRNSYGALCLNTPNVFFADIDMNLETYSCLLGCLAMIAVLVAAKPLFSLVGPYAIVLFLLSPLCTMIPTLIHKCSCWIAGGPEPLARSRIRRFSERHPDWNLRVYQTPAGFRVMATHRLIVPDEEEVQQAFKAMKADRLYVLMCRNQRCFRARLTAKPWRIGITSHMRPRPGIWPVQAERLPIRQAWIREYEHTAKSFAACQFIESIGSGIVHPDIRPVIDLHDQLSAALSGRPIA